MEEIEIRIVWINCEVGEGLLFEDRRTIAENLISMHVCIFGFFGDRVSLCSPDWP